jgi:flavin reductase (DIM6/NTAB) family NADH-FMN oxidoreductase RutF
MNEQAKSDLLNKLTYGLYVLTAEAGGERGGMLVTWVTQASFGPPLVAVGVKTNAHTTAVMKQSGAFALNFMADEQRKEAAMFGQKHAKVGDKLANQAYKPGDATGSPILEIAFGYLECRIKGWLEAGDHDVVLGEIVGAEIAHDAALMTTATSGMHYAG